MKFLDASVFLHAYLRPTKKVPDDVGLFKRKAKAIIKRIEDGEGAVTSLVHISEIANILGSRASVETTCDIISGLLDLPNLKVIEPSKKLYESAVEESRSYNIGINDSLAWILMKRESIFEVYSFDGDYDKIEGLKRVTE